ncbi:MAG: peptidoglycan D,D-transpeptidase FtsI family protein, partial [Egibacteraceae bacterium]
AQAHPHFARLLLAGVAADCGRVIARARSGRRLAGFLVVYLVLTALMTWRLVSVQVVSAAEYRGLAARQTQRELDLPARRGRLYDRTGEPLAMSLAATTVYANPRLLHVAAATTGMPGTQEGSLGTPPGARDRAISVAGVAAKLAPVLGADPHKLVRLLQRDQGFVYLARQLPRQVGQQVAALKLPGIGVLEEPTRAYPGGSLAAQVIGFAGIDNRGLSGLESQYDTLLAGRPGQLRLERAPGGLTINTAPRAVRPATPGADLVLTIDRQIQYTAERALAAGMQRSHALGGSAVVLDARTGEVLALASAPGYLPADIGTAEPYARRNRAVTDMFEPGSVNKVVTIAAALEEGIVQPETTFTVPWQYQVGREKFHDSEAHETRDYTVSDIMEQSSNVGTIQIAQRLGPQRLHDYTARFGVGAPTGLGFPGESSGRLPEVKDWSASSLPTIAIGQGVAATLLQVAGAIEVVASGGEWIEPSLVRGRLGLDGRVEPLAQPKRQRVVSAQTARAVSEMLVRVVEAKHGTGSRAAVPGYRVGGKTGTAQKPSLTHRGYEPGAFIGSFVGFAPAENPALIVAVMLDEPTPHYGGLTAAPVFSEIMRFALVKQRAPPSRPNLDPAPASPTSVSDPPESWCTVADVSRAFRSRTSATLSRRCT